MRVALFGKYIADAVIPCIQELVDHFSASQGRLFIYTPFFDLLKERIHFKENPLLFDNQKDIAGNVDFLFSVGGDGTILEAVRIVGDTGIPVAGINMGRLGFLSGIPREMVIPAVESIERKDYLLEQRTLIELVSPPDLFGGYPFALNDLTVYKPHVMSMLTIRTWVNGEFLNAYWADGLIVATPTGSTAYSLSCTGPILAPGTESLVVTPIASHNLTVRPIVLRDDSEVKIRVESKVNEYLVSLDSHSRKVSNGVELLLRKAPFKINLLRLPDKDFFQTIREKLNWGLDNRN